MSNAPWDVELVGVLTDLADPDTPNRAALAQLRRGLTAPPDYTLGRLGWLFRRVPDQALQDAVLVAGLFAWLKGALPHRSGINFGAAFGAGLTPERKHQREKRFVDLLDTDKDDLPYKLRQATTLIGRDGGGLDWQLLIKHCRYWDHPDRWVQTEWARGFWGKAPEDAATTTADPE